MVWIQTRRSVRIAIGVCVFYFQLYLRNHPNVEGKKLYGRERGRNEGDGFDKEEHPNLVDIVMPVTCHSVADYEVRLLTQSIVKYSMSSC